MDVNNKRGIRLENKLIYQGMDLTIDLYEKIRAVVELIAACEENTFDESYALFAASNTYAALLLPDTLMWSESPGFIVHKCYRESDSAYDV